MSAVAESRTRHLEWDGCFNVRDLGGLPTVDGGQTAWRAVVRADSLSMLTARGWEQAAAYGIRTVIDLRNEDERGEDVAPRPAAIRTISAPLDEIDAQDFWEGAWEDGPQFATPLYYGPHLESFPARSAEVIAALANAGPGGVAFHCVGGRDRSGQIAMLVLALAGVGPRDIAADYALSSERLRTLYRERGEADQGPVLEAFLRERGTTAGELIVKIVETADFEAKLAEGGVGESDIRSLRNRLLAPARRGRTA
jgi:protein-tyrosine phosphatase